MLLFEIVVLVMKSFFSRIFIDGISTFFLDFYKLIIYRGCFIIDEVNYITNGPSEKLGEGLEN